jgi:hypothetical protein
MNKTMGGAFLAVGAPALAAGLLVAPTAASAATAAPATAAHAKPAPLRVAATVSNSRPKDRTIEYIEVKTSKGARVTTVAHFRNGNQTRTTTANSRGDATVAYAVGNATPGYRVTVTVAVTSGRNRASTVTSFTPQRR